MKKYITTLFLAAAASIHAQAADLEDRLLGYWQPDMPKTLALAKEANREIDPLEQAMMGKMVFEFKKDEMIVHGPPGDTAGTPPVPYTVAGVDQAKNSLTLSAGGAGDAGQVQQGADWRSVTRTTAGRSSTA